MEPITVNYKVLDARAKVPAYATPGSAAADLCAVLDEPLTVQPMERVLVFLDDISLEPGHVRIRRKGTDGGHNGLKNIIYLTGSDQFPRVKIGVGAKPHPDYDLAKWVLSRFSSDEQKALDSVLDHVADMARLIVSGRMDEAMNGYNGK